jgi:uncharacterized membrane protein
VFDLTSAMLMVDEFAGIAWYGKVFFMTFVLLPSIENLTANSKGPRMHRIFPRIFNVATVTSSVTVAAGLALALLYSNFDPGIFLDSSWGLIILIGGSMGLFMFLLPAAVETVELRALRHADPASAGELPAQLAVMEKRVKLLPRVSFVLLTVALFSLMYAADGV